MRLKPEHHHLSTLTLEYSFLGQDPFCFQVHLHCPKLGVGWWDIVRFPLHKLRDGLKVKQAMLPPKQDIAVFSFSLSSLKSPTRHNESLFIPDLQPQRRQYCPSCFVSIATAALNLALPSLNKYKVAKLVENRCPRTVCQIHSKVIFVTQLYSLFITLHQQFRFQAGSTFTVKSDLIREAF